MHPWEIGFKLRSDAKMVDNARLSWVIVLEAVSRGSTSVLKSIHSFPLALSSQILLKSLFVTLTSKTINQHMPFSIVLYMSSHLPESSETKSTTFSKTFQPTDLGSRFQPPDIRIEVSTT